MRTTKTITATLAVMVVAPQKKITTKKKRNPLALRAALVEMTTKTRKAEPTMVAGPRPHPRLQVPVAVEAAAAAVQAAAAKNPAALRRSPAAARKAVPRRRAPAAAV